MKNLDWEDLKIFIRVARGGGLSAAAAELGLSPATVGRRMIALERAVARPLFVRRQSGYELTDDGRTLLAKALAMEAGARPIEDWLRSAGERSVVRISAGTWTANFFAANFSRLWTPDDPFRIAFKTTEARLDIAPPRGRDRRPQRRRRRAPTSPRAARSRWPMRRSARATSRVGGRDDWVAIAPEDAMPQHRHAG